MRTATQIVKEILQGTLTAQAVITESLNIIKQKDGQIGAFLEVFGQEALNKAKAVDAKKQKGEKLGKLAGVPVAIKDNLLYEGHKVTCASKMLEHYVSPYTAHVIKRLEEEDAVIIGRVNMDEFAMGSSCENSAFQITRNPLNLNKIPGGSSGGSAACVAAGMVPVALGSDTGGSIRQPSACCGVTGIKPTYGLVSRNGLIAFASGLDQVGPITKNIEDNALVLSVISGYDKNDATSLNLPVPDYEKNINGDVKGLKIGIPFSWIEEACSDEIKQAFKEVTQKLKDSGAIVNNITLKHAEKAVCAYYVVAPSQASSNLARFDGQRYGLSERGESADLNDTYIKTRAHFGHEVKRRIMLGTFCLSSGYYDAYYGKAQKVIELLKGEFDAVFKDTDAVIMPAMPTLPFNLGEKTESPVEMYMADIFTIPANLAGINCVCVPYGNYGGLKAGIQIHTNKLKEQLSYNIGRAIEKFND